MRIAGSMKFFNVAKGFGFVASDDGSKDVFVQSALEAAGIRSLDVGDKVTFILNDDRRGRGRQAGSNSKGITGMPRCSTCGAHAHIFPGGR
jgi:CspA family cold shock protein